MDIFTDDLSYDDMDFTIFYNEDGEAVRIDEMEEEQLKNILSTLDRHIRMLPEHNNIDIWIAYRQILKKELAANS